MSKVSSSGDKINRITAMVKSIGSSTILRNGAGRGEEMLQL